MKVLLLSISLFYTAFLLGQAQSDPTLEKYYPVSEIIKKNKVKRCVFTHASFSDLNSTTEYDSLGRGILYLNGTLKSYTSYIESKDTLIAITYWEDDKVNKYLHAVEKFVYNENKSIVFYSSCGKWWASEHTGSVYKRFVYNSCDQLVSIYHYKTTNYPLGIRLDFPIIDSFYKLIAIEVIEENESIYEAHENVKDSIELTVEEYYISGSQRYLYGTYKYEFY